jgi:hypothetical protein
MKMSAFEEEIIWKFEMDAERLMRKWEMEALS